MTTTKTKPLVSVILPTYNQEFFVEESVTSVISQDYKNLEILIGDDASIDNTAKILNKIHSNNSEKIKLFLFNNRKGVTGNCNRILKECKGKYIVFFAGDDIMLPGKISQQVDWLEKNSNRVLCGHDAEIFDSKTGLTLFLWSDHRKMRSGFGAEIFLKYGTAYPGASIVARKDAIPKYGFDKRLKTCSDWKLYVDILANGGEFGFLDCTLVRYRRHENNVSHKSSQDYYQDQVKALEILETEHSHAPRQMKIARSRTYHENGIRLLLDSKSAQARKFLLMALFSGRWCNIKTIAGLLLSLIPSKRILHLASKYAKVIA